MNNILVIAKNTFKETIRDKILYGILAFALLFLLSTVFFGSISLGEDIKVVKDFGLAGIYIFSIIITIFLGTSLIYKEIEKRTLYVILSKPVSVSQFLLGKFLGLFMAVLLNLALMTVVHLLVVYFKGGGFDYLSLWAILLQIFEIALFIAVTILFSTISTPLAGAIYSIILLYIGHSLSTLQKYAEKSGAAVRYLTDFIYYLFPNLEKFNIRNNVVHGVTPTGADIIYPILYSVMFAAILLWLATLSLKNQEY
jgi:ABC-type transport system involved in multi-copper enzyme maturation permease subunit